MPPPWITAVTMGAPTSPLLRTSTLAFQLLKIGDQSGLVKTLSVKS